MRHYRYIPMAGWMLTAATPDLSTSLCRRPVLDSRSPRCLSCRWRTSPTFSVIANPHRSTCKNTICFSLLIYSRPRIRHRYYSVSAPSVAQQTRRTLRSSQRLSDRTLRLLPHREQVQEAHYHLHPHPAADRADCPALVPPRQPSASEPLW